MNRIREQRTAAAVSMNELAERIGVSYQYMSRMERADRNVSIKWLYKVSAALSVAPAALLPAAATGPKRAEFVDDLNELAWVDLWRSWDAGDRRVALKMLGGIQPALDDTIPEIVVTPRRKGICPVR